MHFVFVLKSYMLRGQNLSGNMGEGGGGWLPGRYTFPMKRVIVEVRYSVSYTKIKRCQVNTY